MNSSNGTFVNGQRIVKARLKEGDILEIGKTVFRFGLEDEKNVRHIPTLYASSKKSDKTTSLVDTLIERELRQADKVYLEIIVTYGNNQRETIDLHQRIIYIGRASSFGAFDQDTEISRKHLMIKLNDTGEVFIEDQGSTNGVFLNGQKISGMHRVQATDEVRVGRCILK
ncbi:MAG: FHA domain-containing protein, partial [Proteobacteria bacterium]